MERERELLKIFILLSFPPAPPPCYFSTNFLSGEQFLDSSSLRLRSFLSLSLSLSLSLLSLSLSLPPSLSLALSLSLSLFSLSTVRTVLFAPPDFGSLLLLSGSVCDVLSFLFSFLLYLFASSPSKQKRGTSILGATPVNRGCPPFIVPGDMNIANKRTYCVENELVLFFHLKGPCQSLLHVCTWFSCAPFPPHTPPHLLLSLFLQPQHYKMNDECFIILFPCFHTCQEVYAGGISTVPLWHSPGGFDRELRHSRKD